MFRGAYTVEWFNECPVYFRAWLDNYIRLQRPAKVSSSKFISYTEKTAASPPLVFPAKWRLRDERRNSTLMTRCYSDLGGASDWSSPERNFLQPIRSTTQIWVVTRAAWNFCTRFSDSISRETSGGVGKCRLFSQGYFIVLGNKVFVISSILLLRKKKPTINFQNVPNCHACQIYGSETL